MDDVLTALGRSHTTICRLWLASVVAGTTLIFVVGPHLLNLWTHIPSIVIQASIAVIWVYWLGWLFPKRWSRQLQQGGRQKAYALAFYTDIIPGVCVNFSQILRPVFYGLLVPAPILASRQRIVLGVVVLAVGQLLILLGLRVIGIAGAMFVWEYTTEEPVLTTCGVYGYIRHPLFLGGVISSLGFAIAFHQIVPLGLAAVNVALLPIFSIAESRRCAIVFGERYPRYEMKVAAIFPRSDRVIQSYFGRRPADDQVIASPSVAESARLLSSQARPADVDRG